MIPILSWRNVWRNRTRSIVVITAIALGIWAAIFMSSFASGMVQTYVQNAIENVVSHLQMHHPEFLKEYDSQYFIREKITADSLYESFPEIKGVSLRGITSGMLSSAKGARGVRIKAIHPEDEARVSKLDEKTVAGEYFGGDRRNQILLSEVLAERLHVDVRSKVVLTFQDVNGSITAAAFRIVGLYDTGNNPFDEMHVFIDRSDYNRLFMENAEDEMDSTAVAALPEVIIHEVAIMVNDVEQIPALQEKLSEQYPDLLTENYREISPDLDLYESQIRFVSIIYLTIIMLALIFGIINTMLMAVLERIRELGMLMAIGMNKTRVFFMIMLETIMLGLVAAPFGILIGWLTVKILGKTGINLSRYSESMQDYGMSEIIYPVLQGHVYWQVAIAVAITAILASIYPALKAIRLNPVEAIRSL